MLRFPTILGFEPGEAMLDTVSVAVGIGVTWGSANLKLYALEFSREKLDEVLQGNTTAQFPDPIDNKRFYEEMYSKLPLAYQRKFWEYPFTKKLPVSGITVDIGGKLNGLPGEIAKNTGKVVERAAALGERLLVKALDNEFFKIGTILKQLMNNVPGNVPALLQVQNATSGNALLHGMRGRDTYNMDLQELMDCKHIAIIQAGIGAITQFNGNIVFISNEQYKVPEKDLFRNGPAEGIVKIISQSVAWAIVPDAAIGLILPAIQVSVITG